MSHYVPKKWVSGEVITADDLNHIEKGLETIELIPGPEGPAGKDGKSAYQDAVEAGYTGTEEAFNGRLAQIEDMCLEPFRISTPAMGQTAENGLLELYEIRGNTVLGGTPAYDAPVSLESVESPLKIHMTGKNLIDTNRFLNKESTQDGITLSVTNAEINLSGTSTSESVSTHFLMSGSSLIRMLQIPSGTYTFSGSSNADYSKGVNLYLNMRKIDGTYITDKSILGNESITFDLAEDVIFQVGVSVKPGSNVDGIVLRPQLEVGNTKTDFEEYTGSPFEFNKVGGIDIPLIGTDGQALDPLRMSYVGDVAQDKIPVPDRVIRKNGIWYIERNNAVVNLTNATWQTGSGYLRPTFDGSLIKGQGSVWVQSTHFPARGDAGAGNGIWMGTHLVINNGSLPNGSDTTTQEMTEWCASQAEAGTPVLALYTLKEPVYEKLHQDVQVLLNTLCVPDGTCSVWFEGEVLPDADIGLPRGDYPNVGVEGAYRWLAELSSPLPTPTQDDLHGWALTQQRSGVFVTDGAVTTKNVPEAGNLTGTLSVTKQGEDVSMLVFGPTGKVHAANRMAGVWRGWSTLATQEQLDTKIGEIGTALDAINGEVV